MTNYDRTTEMSLEVLAVFIWDMISKIKEANSRYRSKYSGIEKGEVDLNSIIDYLREES